MALDFNSRVAIVTSAAQGSIEVGKAFAARR